MQPRAAGSRPSSPLRQVSLWIWSSISMSSVSALVLASCGTLPEGTSYFCFRPENPRVLQSPMFESAGTFLHPLPLLCLFLSILLGTIIGRFHFKGVGLGSVVGTLVAGIIIGILAKPELPEMLRWSFFYLFLFSIGYSVGPQFFGSLKKEALPQIALALVVAFTGLATVVAVAAAFRFDEGIAVGILSGGMTQSAALGTGLSAIAELPIDAVEKATLVANAPLADAITYGFGDLGLILFLTWLGPKLLRADLKADAKALERQ